jgi:putative ABC transport system permease protein
MRAHPTYRDNWRFLDAVPGVWDRLAAGEGVLINEQLHRRAGLSLGAPVDIAPGVSLPVLGIHGDYGNPIGQVVLTEPRFAALFPDERPLRFGLRLDPDDVPALRTRLADGAGLPEAAFLNQAAAKQFSLDVFDRTFRVTAALNALTLGVAGLALLLSLVTLAALRLPMVAPVWALGVTRSVLGWVELGRLMLLAALTGVLALPLGLALAWALLSIVNVAAFGWRLPLFLFPGDWLRLWAVALGAAALAAAWPAWRLARTAPATLTQVFAHER